MYKTIINYEELVNKKKKKTKVDTMSLVDKSIKIDANSEVKS